MLQTINIAGCVKNIAGILIFWSKAKAKPFIIEDLGNGCG